MDAPDYTAEQAADFLGISTRQVRTYCNSNRLKARRAGKRLWLISAKDLSEFAKKPRSIGNPNFKRQAAKKS